MAPALVSQLRPVRWLLVLALAFAASGCVATSSVDALDGVTPSGGPFSQALFGDYAYLAHSFQVSGTHSATAFDAQGTLALAGLSADETDLANAFADKALKAALGEDVLPEDPIEDNAESTQVHDELLKALDPGADKAPELAARAQASYDCWVMDSAVDSMANAAAQCHGMAVAALAQLAPGFAAAPAPQASTPAPAPAPAQTANPDYTVYFDFDSWTLTAEDLTELSEAIAAARQGRQSTISVVGHTDTAGPADYNQTLSVRRANVVKDALVEMGARSDAVKVSGVGESDLAVQTADGVREPKNRRAVITLVP